MAAPAQQTKHRPRTYSATRAVYLKTSITSASLMVLLE